MGSKRKHRENGCSKPHKRPRRDCNQHLPIPSPTEVQHPTLSLYYPHISSLQQYLLSRLQASAPKARIRRLSGARNSRAECTLSGTDEAKAQDGKHDGDKTLGSLLSSTFVCYDKVSNEAQGEAWTTDFAAFSQQSLSTNGSSIEEGTASQTEVSIDSTVLILRIKSLLCLYFQLLRVSDLLGWIADLSLQTKWTYVGIDRQLCHLAALPQEIPKCSQTAASPLSWLSTRETANQRKRASFRCF